MNTKGMGIAFSLPVSDLVGIAQEEDEPKEEKTNERETA